MALVSNLEVLNVETLICESLIFLDSIPSGELQPEKRHKKSVMMTTMMIMVMTIIKMILKMMMIIMIFTKTTMM